LTLLGAVLASADTFAARLRFGRFIGMMSSEENTYFLRAFEVLGATEDRRAADPNTQATAGFKAIMREAAAGSIVAGPPRVDGAYRPRHAGGGNGSLRRRMRLLEVQRFEAQPGSQRASMSRNETSENSLTLLLERLRLR
jgi:hypothetical protein